MLRWLVCCAWLCAALLCVPRAAAQSCRHREDRFGWYTPDYVQLRTGGHQGFLTLGTGYQWFDSRLEAGAQYGWVPAALGGKSLHSLALNVNGRARGKCLHPRINWSYVYGGIGLLFPVGGDGFFFVKVPERYNDRRYYRRNGIRLLLTLGTELQILQRLPRVTFTHGVFFEITAFDHYLIMWGQNPRALSIAFPWSSGFGYRLRF